jgi:hypothetical protein
MVVVGALVEVRLAIRLCKRRDCWSLPAGSPPRRRWVWFVEGRALPPLSAAGWWQADRALEDWNWGGTAPPVLYPPFGLLPGGAALVGLLALGDRLHHP